MKENCGFRVIFFLGFGFIFFYFIDIIFRFCIKFWGWRDKLNFCDVFRFVWERYEFFDGGG